MPTCAQLVQAIENGSWDTKFERLYGADRTSEQRVRYIDAIHSFESNYGGGREVAIYSTPGRTEIGGNHTDHNHGIVMAAAVNLDIIAVISKNGDGIARVKSKGFDKPDSVDLASLEPVDTEFGTSAAMIRGVAAGIKNRKGTVGGFDAYTANDVLRGSGLSSSAAFEVCMASILNEEYNSGRFTAVELGQISQYAENAFFGKPSGLMDQTACAVGGAIRIDFADPQKPVVDAIDFDLASYGYRLVITDTKGSHANLTDEYASIRAEMEGVAGYFDKPVLRDVPREAFFDNIPDIRRHMSDRAILRAIHFYEECRRVGALVEAVELGRFDWFKTLIIESGHSSFEYNQNAYSVKDSSKQGVSLGLALSQTLLNGAGAWRLQGGGFAGTIQAFVPENLLEAYKGNLQAVFGDDACYVLFIRADGAIKVSD